MMSGSPTKLPSRMTPSFGDGNSNIKLPGTTASTPGGEGGSQIPGCTKSKATGMLANHGGAVGISTDMLLEILEKGANLDAESLLNAMRRQVRCDAQIKGRGAHYRKPQTEGISSSILECKLNSKLEG